MRRIFSKFVFSALLMALAVFASVLTSPASFASAASQKATLATCKNLTIQVYGNTSTSSCRDQMSATEGGVSPYTSVVGCSNYSLVIYADANFSGWTICFYGAGLVNMTDYAGPAPYFWWNWNDQGSSYKTGCNVGTFYSDTNAGGQAQSFGASQNRNFDGQGGRLANDTLSSIYIDYDC